MFGAIIKAAMPVLSNSKREQFALAIAKGVSAAKAYTSAGYSECGAKQSAARLLRNADVRSRVAHLQAELSAGTISLEISSSNARVQALQDRWDRMRQVIEQRAASPDFVKVPGGTTGLLCRDLRCKDTPVYKLDTGLLAELRAHEQQAAQELSQWQTRSVVEEPKVIEVTPAARALASMLSLEQLEELERKLVEEEKKVSQAVIETTGKIQ
jgi:HAMP domain-containing protein